MNTTSVLRFNARQITHSKRLRRILSGLTETVIAVIDTEDRAVALSSFLDPSGAGTMRVVPAQTGVPAGDAVAFMPIEMDPNEIARLADVAPPPVVQGKWFGYRCLFRNGETDFIAVNLTPVRDPDAAKTFLSTIWPVLRDDCLRDCQLSQAEVGDDALLWLIASRIDLGVLVVNERGLILRANRAAKQMMDSGTALVRGFGGIRGIDDVQTRALRIAIAACSSATPDDSEATVFIQTNVPGTRVPVTLSRFSYDGQPTKLVTLLLPARPDTPHIERLARDMGLTGAEARVAAQLQLGLSNREAARSIGLTEQSFSTYAKRVMSKLNVSSRAEMAQMLTWQSHAGRIS